MPFCAKIATVGKSSLLKFLGASELQQCYGYDLHDRIFILTDCREYLQKTREDFFRTVCDQIIVQSQPTITLHPSSLRNCLSKTQSSRSIEHSGRVTESIVRCLADDESASMFTSPSSKV